MIQDLIIRDLVAAAPASLKAAAAKIAIGPAPPCGSRRQARAVVDDAITRFGVAFGPADRRAVVSFWSMHYLAALILPATVALVRLDRALPVALDDIGLDLAADGTIQRVLLRDEGVSARAPYFALLAERQLAPFVAVCVVHGGLSPRVLWANAAVMLDYAVGELTSSADASPSIAEAKAMLEGHVSGAASNLARPYVVTAAGDRVRRVCCLRVRLPGVPSCGVCPLSTLRTGTAIDGRTVVAVAARRNQGRSFSCSRTSLPITGRIGGCS